MKSEDCLLSIIIPHYNSLKTLDRLLQSIFKQKLIDNLQVIIVDDNSTDEYSELVKKWGKEKNLIILNNNGVKGAGTCRNIGLSVAKGKWIVFADADDYFLPNFYEIIIKNLDNDSDIIYFKPTSINDDTGEISNRHEFFEELILSKSPDRNLLLKFKIVVPWSKVYLKDFIVTNKILFDEVLVSNDVMFASRCGVSNPKIKVCNEIIYCVTKNSGTLTTTVSSSRYFQRLEVFIKSCNYIKSSISSVEYKKLDFNGAQFIINMFVYKLNFSEKILVIRELRKAKIKLVSLKKFKLRTIKKNIDKIFLEKKYRFMKEL